MAYGVGGTTNRIVGMASGLDVDALVKAMMSTEQSRLDSMNQQKTYLQWQTDAYNEVNTLVTNFTNKYFSVLSSDSVISDAAFQSKRVVTNADQYATITAGATANNGSYTINEITSLATGAAYESASLSTTTDATLSSLSTDPALSFVDDKIKFSINGQSFEFSSTDKLQKVINVVNGSSAGVTMAYSSLSKKLTITSKTTGTGTDFAFEDINGNFKSALGFTETSSGSDAVLKINGYDVDQKSNSFTIDGVTYNLLKKTNTGDTLDFSISSDNDKTFNQIKNFVNDYNTLIDTLNSKISEEKYSDYPPLTDDQRSAMKDSEITDWEKKAKSGLLNSDDNISSLLQDIRTAFNSAVEGTGLSASQIGITTGAYYEKGKLYIDDTKLKEAIADNPVAVSNLFTQVSTSKDSKTKFKESGIAERISDSMKDYTSYLKDKTLVYTADQIKDLSDKITEQLAAMKDKEDAYYNQYSQLEVAMQQLNSQNSSLAALFGSSSSDSSSS